jgi:hypothetical protein
MIFFDINASSQEHLGDAAAAAVPTLLGYNKCMFLIRAGCAYSGSQKP